MLGMFNGNEIMGGGGIDMNLSKYSHETKGVKGQSSRSKVTKFWLNFQFPAIKAKV